MSAMSKHSRFYERHGTERSSKYCDFVVRLSLELKCALTHNANDLYVTADREHILFVQDNHSCDVIAVQHHDLKCDIAFIQQLNNSLNSNAE